MNKILVMAQQVEQVADFIRSNTSAKVITETEIADSTAYQQGWLLPGYSDFIVTRTKNLIAGYKFNRPLAVVLDQRHQSAVKNINLPSIRICEDIRPKRLRDAISYKTDDTILWSELSDSYFLKYFTA